MDENLPILRCATHRQQELFSIWNPAQNTLQVETCPLCEKVAVVKTKRQIRKNMGAALEQALNEVVNV